MDYYKEAEELLRSRPKYDIALANLNKKLERRISHSAPSQNTTAAYSDVYYGGGFTSDTISELSEIAKIKYEIDLVKIKIAEVDDVYKQLCEEYREIIRLWYFDSIPKDAICDKMNYSNCDSVYKMRRRAVREFALLCWGVSIT